MPRTVWFIVGAQLTFFTFEKMLNKLSCITETRNTIITTLNKQHIFLDYPVFAHMPLLAQRTHFIPNSISFIFYLQYISLTYPLLSIFTDIIQDQTTISHLNKKQWPTGLPVLLWHLPIFPSTAGKTGF